MASSGLVAVNRQHLSTRQVVALLLANALIAASVSSLSSYLVASAYITAASLQRAAEAAGQALNATAYHVASSAPAHSATTSALPTTSSSASALATHSAAPSSSATGSPTATASTSSSGSSSPSATATATFLPASFSVGTLAGGVGDGSSGANAPDGVGTSAGFKSTRAMTAYGSGALLVCESSASMRLRVVTLATRAVNTLTSDTYYPYGAAVGPAGEVYVTNAGWREVAVYGPTVWSRATLVSGLLDPTGIIYDSGRDILYLTDPPRHIIYTLTRTGTLTLLAGAPDAAGTTDDTGTAARFNRPFKLALSPDGSSLCVSEYDGHRIRRIDLATVAVTTVAGSTAGYADGSGATALFNSPTGVAVDVFGNLFVADQDNHVIRVVCPSGAVLTVAGTPTQAGGTDGPGGSSTFTSPIDLVVASSTVYVLEKARVRTLSITNHASLCR